MIVDLRPSMRSARRDDDDVAYVDDWGNPLSFGAMPRWADVWEAMYALNTGAYIWAAREWGGNPEASKHEPEVFQIDD